MPSRILLSSLLDILFLPRSACPCSDGKRISQDANKEIPLEDIEAAAKKLEGEEPAPQSMFGKAKTAALYGTSYNIHAIIDSDAAVHAIHAGAEVFEERVEFAFGYLQVGCLWFESSVSC